MSTSINKKPSLPESSIHHHFSFIERDKNSNSQNFETDSEAKKEKPKNKINNSVSADKEIFESNNSQLRLSEALHNVAIALNSTLELEELLERILDNLGNVISFVTANVMFIEDGNTMIASGIGYTSDQLRQWRERWNAPLDNFPILKTMGETGSAIVFPDTHQSPEWIHIEETNWIRSYVGAPIFRNQRLYGFINANSDQVNAYNENHAAVMRAFADQAAVAVENARLFEETRKRAEKLELLNEIATKIVDPGTIKELLQSAADGLAAALGYSQVGIALFTQDKSCLEIVAEHTAPEVDPIIGDCIPVEGNASMEYVINHLHSLQINDAQNDPLLSNIQDIMVRRKVKSILIVPLIVRGELLGTIGCDVIGNYHNFTVEEIRLVETLAGMISTRIEQTQLLDSIKLHADDLENVSHLLHQINAVQYLLDDFSEIGDLIKEITGCQRVSIAILSESSTNYYLYSQAPAPEGLLNGIQLSVNDTSATSDILAGESHLTPNLAEESGYPAEKILLENGFHSRINLPLIVHDRILGSLNLAWEDFNGFNNLNFKLLQQITDAIAMALDRGRLLEETKRRDAILETLAYAAEQLMHFNLIDDVIPGLLTKLGAVTQASRVYLYENRYSEHGEIYSQERFSWKSEKLTVETKLYGDGRIFFADLNLGWWKQQLERGEPVYGALQDFPQVERQVLESNSVQSIVLVPIFVRNTWWGLLGIEDCDFERNWSTSEIDALKNLADTLGGAVARVQSEKAEKDHLALTEALRDVTMVMTSTTNINHVLKHILENIALVLEYDAANVLLVKSQMLEIACVRGYVESGLGDPSRSFPMPVTNFANFNQLLDSSKVIVINDTSSEPNWEPIPEIGWARSNLSAPIRYKEKTIGIINLDSRQPGFFNENDAEKLLSFANQAAIAIENTRLFEETHERALQISLLNRITQVAVGAHTAEEVLYMLTVQIISLLNADNAYITLSNELDSEKPSLVISADQVENLVENYSLLEEINELTEHAIRKGHVQSYDQINTSSIFRELGYSSLMVLPLMSNGQKLGSAVVTFSDQQIFDVDALALAGQAAGQIALAISKTKLLEAEQQKAKTLERVNTILTALSHVAVQLETANNPDDVLKTLGEELRKLQINCMIWMLAPGGEKIQLRYASLSRNEVRAIGKLLRISINDFVLQKDDFDYYHQVLVAGSPVYIEDFRNTMHTVFPRVHPKVFELIRRKLQQDQQVSGFFLPLLAETKVIGTIWMLASEFTQHDQTAATIFASQVALALENARLYQHVSQLAITDELTGLYNRRGLMELGQREFNRARRFNRKLSALMFDLDNFRKINNEFGHKVGDEVLQEVATRCKFGLRSTDVIGRYGGEEFTVLLPETDLRGALEIAERLRILIDSNHIATSKAQVPLSISLGAVELSPDQTNLMELIDRADQGLYLAKQTGKNRVCTPQT